MGSTLSLQTIGLSLFPLCEKVNEEQTVLVAFVENKQVNSGDLAYVATSFNITATWKASMEFVAQKTPPSTFCH